MLFYYKDVKLESKVSISNPIQTGKGKSSARYVSATIAIFSMFYWLAIYY
jgi:hypothetical protein